MAFAGMPRRCANGEDFIVTRMLALLRFRAVQCLRNWRTTGCAGLLATEVTLRHFGLITAQDFADARDAITIMIALMAADAARGS